MRRVVKSHDASRPRGRRPSAIRFASVRATVVEPANACAVVPGRFSTTSSEDNRSPYFAPKAPAVSSKRSTVSGLNAAVRPNSR